MPAIIHSSNTLYYDVLRLAKRIAGKDRPNPPEQLTLQDLSVLISQGPELARAFLDLDKEIRRSGKIPGAWRNRSPE